MAAAAGVWCVRAFGVLQGAGRQLLTWIPGGNVGQVRNYYVDWRMLRDVKRRKMAFEYADERRRLNAIRKNTILPKELQELAIQNQASVWELVTVLQASRQKMMHMWVDVKGLFIKLLSPIQIKNPSEVADQEIASLPRDSCPVRIRNRCVLTSRPRGVKRRWRLSRIVFRHLADHNQMSGIQRAMW